MTRSELLHLLVAQARSNGFEFRRWYVSRLGSAWKSTQTAIDILSEERRYYALLFSHEFATAFWKAGEKMTLQVPAQTFDRAASEGGVTKVMRRGYSRRLTRKDAWRYHLRQMAVAEEPLRYIRRFLRVEEELAPEPEPSPPIFIVDEEDLLPDE